jgi:hypothetical protein
LKDNIKPRQNQLQGINKPIGYIDDYEVGVSTQLETHVAQVAPELVAIDVGLHTESIQKNSDPTPNLLYNAAGKTSPVGAVVFKQEAG